MKGYGPRFERETIINFNDDSDDASIWTASETVYRRLLKAGFELIEDRERSAIFKLPKAQVKFRKKIQRKPMDPEKRAALAARMTLARSAQSVIRGK